MTFVMGYYTTYLTCTLKHVKCPSIREYADKERKWEDLFSMNFLVANTI